MAIRTSNQAIDAALKDTKNKPGTCQMTVRNWFNAPSAGDRDGDGDADAVDGWLSEPKTARHPGDRNPPPGRPLAFSGGSKGYGHRALSLPGGKIRSTDMDGDRYKSGVVGTVSSIKALEKAMGIKYLGWSETITRHKIHDSPVAKPKPPKEVPPVSTDHIEFTIAHASLQFNDPAKQKFADVDKIFSQGFDHITGTEAGRGSGVLNAALIKSATEHGYALALTEKYDTWVAVKKDNIKPGSWRMGARYAFPRAKRIKPRPPGIWGDKAIVWGSYEHTLVGRITLGSMHPVTRRGAGPRLKKKLDAVYMNNLREWGKIHGAGNNLVFIGGDFNASSKNFKLFRSAPFRTCWDDVKRWSNTGHGNIDAIARYLPDKRVRCVGATVQNDAQFFLNTDHFLVVTKYRVQF